LGRRPLLTPLLAQASLADRAGRLRVDFSLGDTILLTQQQSVSFSVYEMRERDVLQALTRHAPAAVFAVNTPPLRQRGEWERVAQVFRAESDGTTGGEALAWFGEGLLTWLGVSRSPRAYRPWAPSFDRAERRAAEPRRPDQMFADWLADRVWGLTWAAQDSFDMACVDLAVRLAVARHLADERQHQGCRPDRAAAEAIMAVELAGHTLTWNDEATRLLPSEFHQPPTR